MPTMKDSDYSTQIWYTCVSLVGCPAIPKVPWIRGASADCATFDDDVLFCPVLFQMCSCVSSCYLYCTSVFTYYVSCFKCVADVVIPKDLCVYHLL